MAVQPNPTTGVGTAAKIALTGTGVTHIAGNQYSVSLSLTGTTSVVLTATIQDVLGATFNSANSNSTTWKSYNTAQATVSAGTVTAVALGQAYVEAQFPTFDGTTGIATGMVYAQILVTVGA